MKENNITGFCLPLELKILESLSINVPENGYVVELGSLFGRTAVAWANYCPTATIMCFDDFVDNYWEDVIYPGLACRPLNNTHYNTYELFLENTREYSNIKHFKGTFPSDIEYDGHPIDLLFVDLCHVNPMDWDTIEIFLPYLKSGATICGHDYLPDIFPDVVTNAKRLAELYNTTVDLYDETSLWSIRI